MRPQEAAVGIIFSSDRTQVLLVKRRDIPVWVLPAGGIERGETPEVAVVRELHEETGYTTAIIRKVAEYEPVNRLTQRTHFFECSIVSGQATLSNETQEISFFPLVALPKLLPSPYPGWIADALCNSAAVMQKKISGVNYRVFLKYLFLHPFLVFRFLLTKVGIHLNF